MLTDKEKDREYEAQSNCNDSEAKQFYYERLEELVTSVMAGDVLKFKNLVKLLNRIDEDRLKSYFEDQDSISSTSILHLTNENSEGKNAYYYAMRCNNMDMLRYLIEKWRIQVDEHQLDKGLSKAYVSFMLQGVKLSDDTKNFVEYSLTRARLKQCIFGNIEQGKGNPENIDQKLLMDVKMRCLFLVDCITDLVSSHKNNAREVDEKTLYFLKVITINVYVLKGRLRCTYDRLPWEEVEFCLVTFIRHFKSTDESGIFYRSYVNKENTLNYLWELSVELSKIVETLTSADLIRKVKATREEIVADISSKSYTFEELYETHANVRDFYPLQTILNFLTFTLSSSKPENMTKTDEVLLIERCLHVLGESMKNTKESPNLSKDLGNFISECFSDYLNKALQEIRDCLSHHDKLRRRTETSDDSFVRIEAELRGITLILEQIFLRVKYARWDDIYNKAKSINSLEQLRHIKEILNYNHTALSDAGVASQRQMFGLMQTFTKFKNEVLRIRSDLQLDIDEVGRTLHTKYELDEDGIMKLM